MNEQNEDEYHLAGNQSERARERERERKRQREDILEGRKEGRLIHQSLLWAAANSSSTPTQTRRQGASFPKGQSSTLATLFFSVDWCKHWRWRWRPLPPWHPTRSCPASTASAPRPAPKRPLRPAPVLACSTNPCWWWRTSGCKSGGRLC